VTDAYLEKSAVAGRMGKAAEFLVAAFCILATRGELNVSTTLVDDEGVDLVFHRANTTATLSVQVKARMSTSAGVARGKFEASVRAASFRPRPGLAMLFIAVDVEHGTLLSAWLVPSLEFAAIVGAAKRGLWNFTASLKPAAKDRWRPYRLEPTQLPPALLTLLAALDGSP